MARRLRNAAILTLSTLLLLEFVLQLGALVISWTHAPGDRPPAGTEERQVGVLCVGDSFTYGLGATSPEQTSYPAQLGAQLEAAEPGRWRAVNGGYPGRDSRGVLERIDAQLAAHAPAFVVILVGLNDRWRQPQRLDLGASPAAAQGARDGFRFEWRTKRLLLWLFGKLTPPPADGARQERGGAGSHVPSLEPDDPWRDAEIPAAVEVDAADLSRWIDSLPATPPGDALPRLRAAARGLADTAPRAALGASVRAFLMTGDVARFTADLLRAPALDDPALLTAVLEPLALGRDAHDAVCSTFAAALGWRQGDGIWLHPATGRQAALVTPRWLEFGPELLAVFETHRFHLEQVISRCRDAGAEPILIGYPNRVSFPDQLFDAIAGATGARFVPTVARFEAVLGTRDRNALFVPDGHCNDAGYELLAQLVREAVDPR